MSDWIHVTGYMVISNDLPCRIGKYGKPFDEVISDEEFVKMWNGEICGESVSDMLGKILIAMSKKWKYFTDKSLLECLQFPCGSEGPLDVTVTPHIDECRTSWHIVFNGNLKDRDSSYFERVKSWWEAMQTMFNVYSGYICCTWLDEKWQNII